MEAAAQLSIQRFLKAITEEEEREVQEQQGQVEEQNDEEFYEEIEAPKFVDFTAADDPFRPDDCYWFCLRVGCDRKHEEELDPEEISKNFVLRVMAARSPNVRLRRALNGRNTSSIKCPLSAPAKSSRSRLPRLAMVSSMSQKIKEKVGTHPKNNSTLTPMVKGKQVASKYMTTPRNKSNFSHPTSFRSVQNPRPTKIAVPKSRLVAKALVFRSPKKSIATETAVELRTPLTKLCEGMKRLEITSQRKRVLGSGKLAKGTKCKQNSTVVESSKPQTIHNGKCMHLCHHDCKVKEAKSLRKVKISNKQILTEQFKKVSENNSGNEITDVREKDGSALTISVTEGNVNGEPLIKTQASEIIESGDSKEDMAGGSSNTSTNSEGDAINSLSNIDTNVDIISRDGSVLCHVVASEVIELEAHLKTRVSEKEVLVLQLPSGKNSATVTNNAGGDVCSLTNLEGLNATRSHTLVEEGREDRDRIKVEDHERKSSKDELMHSDDKENAQASDENRAFSCNNNHSKKKLLGTKKIHEKDKKVVRDVNKKVKDGIITVATGASDVKKRKPKPTISKPFRLRTDERGILKESNLERRFHQPQKQDAAVPSFRGGNLHRRCGNDIKGNEKCSVQSNGSSDKLECGNKESLKDVEKAEDKWSRTARLQTIREQACRTAQKRLISNQKIPNCTTSFQKNSNKSENKKPDHCIRKLESPSMHQQIIKPQGKLMNSSKHRGNGLFAIKETSKASQPKSAGKPYESGFVSVTKSTSSASKPSTQGRSLSTFPRGSVFHTASSSCQGSAKKIV